jgi:hypothetical protein
LNFILDASWQKAIAFSEVSRSGCENFTAADLVAEQIVQHNKSDRPHPIT